jgi:hemoglobin/transferrin/lactoferrin receptor protein
MRLLYPTILFLFFFRPAFAQTERPEDTLRTGYLDEVVVSVNRWEQNLREISNRIARIGRPAVALQNPQTTADLLGISNQVFIQKSQLGGGSPMIRGFATSRVLLVVDGVRMNNAIFRGGNVQNVISLDANTIEQAEVIFGPGSVMYGSDAVGGVMDFHTLDPALAKTKNLEVKAHALARYSSANQERTGHLNFTVAGKKWSWLTSYTSAHYGDLRMGSRGPEEFIRPDFQVTENGVNLSRVNPDPNVQVPSGFSQQNWMQKIRYRPTAHIDLQYAYHDSRTSDVPRYDRLILRDANGNFANAEWYYGPQKWKMHHLRALYSRPTAWADRAKLTLAFQDYTESRHNRNFAGGNRLRRTNRFENVKAWSANLDLDKQLTERITLFYGAEWVYNEVGSTAFREHIVTGETAPVSTRYPNGSTWRSAAAYISTKVHLNHRWLLNASGRFTHTHTFARFDNTFFDFPFTEAALNNGAVNGSIGAVYNPSASLKFYGNISNAFRAPNVDDIGKVFDSQPGAVVVPNPELQPEIAYNFELGSAGTVAENLTFDVAGFYTTINNAIGRGAFTFNGLSQIDYDGALSQVLAQQNVGGLFVYGWQAGLRWKIAPAVVLTSNYNWQRGKETDVASGQRFSPTHVAPHFGATQFTYQRKKWRAMVSSVYNAAISFDRLSLTERADRHLYATDENGNPYAPGWTIFNLNALYDISRYLQLSAGVENLLDRRYRPYSSGITAPGRNVIMAVRARL